MNTWLVLNVVEMFIFAAHKIFAAALYPKYWGAEQLIIYCCCYSIYQLAVLTIKPKAYINIVPRRKQEPDSYRNSKKSFLIQAGRDRCCRIAFLSTDNFFLFISEAVQFVQTNVLFLITQRTELQYNVGSLRGCRWLSDPLIGSSTTRIEAGWALWTGAVHLKRNHSGAAVADGSAEHERWLPVSVHVIKDQHRYY